MPHTLETASSGRSKCRGCGSAIAKGALRFGERLPNVFADGEMTLWFHVTCAAYRRPESFCELRADDDGARVDDLTGEGATGEGGAVDWAALDAVARVGVEHPRLQRISATQRSKTGRASCRHCREAIAKDTLRIVVQYFEDARFVPSGFLHPGCALAFVGTPVAKDAVARATTELTVEEVQQVLDAITAD